MVSAPVPFPVTARSPFRRGLRAGDAETYAQVAFKGVADDHDARFDQHLPHGHVQGLHQAADVRQLVRGVLDQQGVCALIDRQRAARRQHGILAARGLDQFRQIRDLGVVDLHELGAGRRQFLHFFVRVELRLFTGREFLGRTDDDHVILAALVQALGAQHDVERLIPGHVLQPQRQIAGDGIADHDVLAAGIRQQLQHRAHIDVLEVQGQPLAGVFLLFLGRRALRGRLDFNCVLVVGLVGQLLEIALRADHEARAALDTDRIDRLHRGCEIHDVVTAHQVLGHHGAGKVHDDLIAFLTHIHRRARVG